MAGFEVTIHDRFSGVHRVLARYFDAILHII